MYKEKKLLKNIPCVIVAGGKSSRMGKDKALLPFGGFDTLTQFQIHRLKPLFKSLHVSTKEEKFSFDIPLIKDKTSSTSSPMVALEAILENFEDTYVFILSVDTPFVTQEEIEKLFLHVKGDVTIAKDKEKNHPLCGFYHTNLLSKVKEKLEKDIHKLGKLLDEVGVRYVEFDSSKPFFNLNHPHEYEDAKGII